MKPRAVVLAPEAVDDLQGLYDWVAAMASPVVAMRYLERVERFVAGLSVGSERGHLHRVTVLRVLRAGQDWGSSF